MTNGKRREGSERDTEAGGAAVPAAGILAALADPMRRRIFERIVRCPRSVGEIARGLPVSQPAVSQHLRVLRRTGLVRIRKEGARRIYRADADTLAALAAYVAELCGNAAK